MITTVTLTKPLQVADFSGSDWKFRTLPQGEYQVEDVANPLGLAGEDDHWLVLAGTQEGMRESVWRRHCCRGQKRSWLKTLPEPCPA
ncbi:MAG: hypothetical protein WC518_00985 [Patescibacteria group bacterium]